LSFHFSEAHHSLARLTQKQLVALIVIVDVSFLQREMAASTDNRGTRLALIEPYYGGSHRSLVDILQQNYPESDAFTMRPKKWHW